MTILRQLAEAAKEWNEAGSPVGDATDTYPGELFSDACTPAAILALLDKVDHLEAINGTLGRIAKDGVRRQYRKIQELTDENKQLRRMLCLAKATMPYMDDGEASDSSEFPHIDYMRDSPSEIQGKLNQRLYNKAVQASFANIDNVISEIKQPCQFGSLELQALILARLVADNQSPKEKCNDSDKLTSTDASSTGD